MKQQTKNLLIALLMTSFAGPAMAEIELAYQDQKPTFEVKVTQSRSSKPDPYSEVIQGYDEKGNMRIVISSQSDWDYDSTKIRMTFYSKSGAGFKIPYADGVYEAISAALQLARRKCPVTFTMDTKTYQVLSPIQIGCSQN